MRYIVTTPSGRLAGGVVLTKAAASRLREKGWTVVPAGKD